jgi:hypothetical protein
MKNRFRRGFADCLVSSLITILSPRDSVEGLWRRRLERKLQEEEELSTLFMEYMADPTIFWEKYGILDFESRQELWAWLHAKARKIRPSNDRIRTRMRELIAEMLDHSSRSHQTFR